MPYLSCFIMDQHQSIQPVIAIVPVVDGNRMAMQQTGRMANLKTDLADYFRTSLADFYVSPAHRWLVYAVTFILAGLGAFSALTAYDIGDDLMNVPLTFKGMYAWHTAINFAVCLCIIDTLIALLTAPWGAFNRRTVGKTWIVFLISYGAGYISQRTIVYQLMALYSPALIWTYGMNPSQRPGSLSSFIYILPLVLSIAYGIMRMILSMQSSSEELLRVRIDTILEERGRGTDVHSNERPKKPAADNLLQLPTDPGVGPIHPSQIGHVTVEDHYLRIHYHVDDGLKKTLIRMPLKELSARLPEDQFARIHRSHIVNLAWVDGLKRVGREVQLTMKHGDFKLPVSRYRLPQLLPVLEKFLNPGTDRSPSQKTQGIGRTG